MNKEVSKVKRLIRKWAPKLLLQGWDFKVIALPNPKEKNVTLVVEPDPTYLNATVFICPLYKEHDPKEQEEMLVHELMHCKTAEFSDLLSASMAGEIITQKQKFDTEERLTQSLTRMLLKNISKTTT